MRISLGLGQNKNNKHADLYRSIGEAKNAFLDGDRPPPSTRGVTHTSGERLRRHSGGPLSQHTL
jgi:hypothetical protein